MAVLREEFFSISTSFVYLGCNNLLALISYSLPHIKIPIIGADKLAHMSVFFVFCWFSHRALFFQTAFPSLKDGLLYSAFLLTCLYGYFDEVHQLYVPGRTYDYFDLLADAIGAFLFVLLFTILDRRKDKQSSNKLTTVRFSLYIL